MIIRNLLLAGVVASWSATTLAQDTTTPDPDPKLPVPEAVPEPVPEIGIDDAKETPEPRLSPEEELAELMGQIADPELSNVEPVDQRIRALWAQSGSASADLLLERGLEALEKENLIVAVEHLSALIDHAPEFAEAWNARATVFFRMEEFGLSLSDVENALALNPNHYGALAGLAIMLEQLGETEDALKAYRATQSLNPHREQINEAVERLQVEVDGQAL